jgi:S-adenosylmethionine decarboxylase
MRRLGLHLIVEMYQCNREKLDDLSFLERIFVEAAQTAGATVLKTGFQDFNPQGVSGMVIIAESHLSVHSYPEYGYAAVDVFTCGESVDTHRALDYLIEQLECKQHTVESLDRGTSIADT